MPQTTRTIEVAAPIAKLYEIVRDYRRYPEFIPEMRRASVLREDACSQDVEFELELDLPLGLRKKIKYSLSISEERPTAVRWRLLRGEIIKGNVGSWTFRSLDEARTLATYAIEVSFGPLVPRAISAFLSEQTLPKLLAAFKARAEQLP